MERRFNSVADGGQPFFVGGFGNSILFGQRISGSCDVTMKYDLKLPRGAVESVADEVRYFGSVSLETGGFLLAPAGEHTVSMVAVTGITGIVRRHNLFEISAVAIDRLFTFADDKGLWSPAQFHSHQCDGWLSLTDQQNGFRVEGFTSIVIPNFSSPSREVGAWGWWTFEVDEWVARRPMTLCDGNTQCLRFDEEGVRNA